MSTEQKAEHGQLPERPNVVGVHAGSNYPLLRLYLRKADAWMDAAEALIQKLEAERDEWKSRAIQFADTIIAVNVKVFGLDDPYDEEAKEWPKDMLSDKVLELKTRAESSEARIRELEAELDQLRRQIGA